MLKLLMYLSVLIIYFKQSYENKFVVMFVFFMVLFLYVQVENSPRCNNSGTYECGACTCDEHHYGKFCECDGSEASDEEVLSKCIQ